MRAPPLSSDSTHFSAFDQNIFTEWHSRYRRAKRGVLIYWTVETGGSMAVHSQLISCSASEVHAMVEGAMRHGTDMEIETNFVDSHGASFVGFGITRLLDVDLVARFKQINKMKLYLPGRGDIYDYPLLAPALTRPIRWDIIANNYDPARGAGARHAVPAHPPVLSRPDQHSPDPGHARGARVGGRPHRR
ncbi:Tn3 family transposase [Herbidospora cretacea]|uniref:Tn3 family transposase n=1 Tax=Herbidospora cretacea TaxID=28444 RepID=UPI000A7F3A0B|nr:Tn3 family transposase [Herbidospora cretacea]